MNYAYPKNITPETANKRIAALHDKLHEFAGYPDDNPPTFAELRKVYDELTMLKYYIKVFG